MPQLVIKKLNKKYELVLKNHFYLPIFFLSVCAIVEYEYAAKEPDELDLQKGAIIHRIKQMPGGWWQGTLKASGVTGMFPDNFVRVLESGVSSNGNGTTGSGDHIEEGTAVQLRFVHLDHLQMTQQLILHAVSLLQIQGQIRDIESPLQSHL